LCWPPSDRAIVPPTRIGGNFALVDDNGKPFNRGKPERQIAFGVLRLYALSGQSNCPTLPLCQQAMKLLLQIGPKPPAYPDIECQQEMKFCFQPNAAFNQTLLSHIAL
jgi:hypothetical protein